jgi:hypothetical protein
MGFTCALPTGGGAITVSSGMISTCAIVAGGAKCWGGNGPVGLLGNGTYDDYSPVPVDVVG